MSKISSTYAYFDISDFIRPLTIYWVKRISKYSFFNAKRITTIFIFFGLSAAYLIYKESLFLAALFLQIKNFLDAADGEWARQNNRPSYVGRYYDSFGDFLCNVSMHVAIYKVTDAPLYLLYLGILLSHLQVSLNVYYNLVYIHQSKNTSLSRLNEFEKPVGYEYDNKYALTILHFLFLIIYSWQDKIIQVLNKKSEKKPLSKLFMSVISILGLGSQLLITSILLVLDCLHLYWLINIWGLSIIGVAVMLYRAIKKRLK